jgi:hypothetical protein
MARIEMLNDDKGRAALSRQSGQQFRNSLKVARVCSHGYDRKCIHHGSRAVTFVKLPAGSWTFNTRSAKRNRPPATLPCGNEHSLA